MKIKTIQIKLLKPDYDELVKVKKKLKAKNWYEFTDRIVKKGEQW